MPEGDTVWLHARRLDAVLAGRRLARAELRVPALAAVDLTGWTVVEVASRGKHLLVRLADGPRRRTLHAHLRMDGGWLVHRHGQRRRGSPAHEIRAVLDTGTHTAVGYRLHDMALVDTADEARLVGDLGPDLLGDDWDAAEALRRLSRRPGRPLHEALLDQHNLAGVGNLYACELAFLVRASPWTPVSAVDLAAVVDRARRLLLANRDRWEQVTTGSPRRSEETWVYGRAGAACRRCGTPIRRAASAPGPRARVVHWCPTCQPGPAPEGVARPLTARRR